MSTSDRYTRSKGPRHSPVLPSTEVLNNDSLRSDTRSSSNQQLDTLEASTDNLDSVYNKKRRRLAKPSQSDYTCSRCRPAKTFTTLNDLHRHQKSVHMVIPKGDRVWKCNIDRCKGNAKVWPRLDNFKQHVRRIHGPEHLSKIDLMYVSYNPDVHGDGDGAPTSIPEDPPRTSKPEVMPRAPVPEVASIISTRKAASTTSTYFRPPFPKTTEQTARTERAYTAIPESRPIPVPPDVFMYSGDFASIGDQYTSRFPRDRMTDDQMSQDRSSCPPETTANPLSKWSDPAPSTSLSTTVPNVADVSGPPPPPNSQELWACPFHKADPRKFSMDNLDQPEYRGCGTTVLRSIAAVKQHLTRRHKLPKYYCPICYKVFTSSQDRDTHLRARSCEENSSLGSDMLDEDLWNTINRKKPRHMSDEDEWYSIFTNIFASHDRPASPHMDNDAAAWHDFAYKAFNLLGPAATRFYASLPTHPPLPYAIITEAYENHTADRSDVLLIE